MTQHNEYTRSIAIVTASTDLEVLRLVESVRRGVVRTTLLLDLDGCVRWFSAHDAKKSCKVRTKVVL